MRRRCCGPPRVGHPGGQPPGPPAGRQKPPGPSIPLGRGEGGAQNAHDESGAVAPLLLPAPNAAGSGEAAASPGGVPGAAPPGVHHAPRRILALLLPRLPVERLRRPGPVAVWGQRGSRRVVLSVSAEAEAAGLRAGQALADAQAILPGLDLVPEDPAGDARTLERLALWAMRFTPLVGLAGEDGLLLDLTGVGHLFGGEAALLDEVRGRLHRRGLTARGAVASRAGTALALARGGAGGLLPEGGEASAVGPLPLAALRLAPPLVAALHGLGLRDVGSLAAQPRAGLVRRFGAGLARALDEALGASERPISPLRPPPEMEVARDFADPVVTREGIEAALDGLLADLCHRARDPAHLARLFHGKLEALAPECGFERLALAALATDPMIGAQEALAPGGRAARREDLAQLLDRLSQRLPVWRLAPRASHWPERAVRRVGAFEEVAVPQGWAARSRPVRLLQRPLYIGAMALLPDAPPSLLRIGRQAQRVVRAEGPERVEPEWWRDRPERKLRDYYRVELASGARLWVCRVGLAEAGEDPRWVLHGHLP